MPSNRATRSNAMPQQPWPTHHQPNDVDDYNLQQQQPCLQQPFLPAHQSLGPTALSPILPEVLEQIISTVTAEVTHRLNSQSLPGPFDTSLVVETAVVSSLPTHTAPHSSLDAVVTDAVQSGQSTITGESSGPQPMLPNSLHFSANLPLDARISTKLKSKIWNDDYIDFGSLLSNPISTNKFQLSVQASSDGLPLSLSLEPLNRSRKVHSISVWMSAFRIFVGVYTKKHPHESPALMKYSNIVQ